MQTGEAATASVSRRQTPRLLQDVALCDLCTLAVAGAELQELKHQIQLLNEPSSPDSVGRLLQLRRQVLLLQFDTAVRHLGRSDARLSVCTFMASIKSNPMHFIMIIIIIILFNCTIQLQILLLSLSSYFIAIGPARSSSPPATSNPSRV